MDTQSITYPSCPIESHSQEPLSRICLDSKCQNRVAVCCICEFEKHQSHNTFPIKHILKQLAESAEQISPAEGASKLSTLRRQFFELISKCRKEIMDELSKLETKGELYFNTCEETLLSFYSLGQPLPVQTQNDPKLYQRYFKKLITLIPQTDKKAFSLSQKVNALLEGFNSMQKRMNDQLGELQNDFKKSVKTAQSIFQGLQSYDAKWSETLKGAKIKITDKIAEQSGMESSGQRFLLMEHPLSKSMKTQWGIKVKKFTGWVGVGICLKEKIKTANYHFNYTNIGHGSYLISTNGYTWSHSVKEFNSAFKCFTFTVNDIVYIEYDPFSLKLRFRKNQGNEKYELDLVPPLPGDVYHPCVNLCSTGDSVELILPGIPLS